jgi:hypothetical protein
MKCKRVGQKVEEFSGTRLKYGFCKKLHLTLLLVIGKFHVKQVKWYRFRQNQVIAALKKKFLFHSMC